MRHLARRKPQSLGAVGDGIPSWVWFAGLAALDLPLGTLATFTAAVRAVPAAAVQKFAREHLRGGATSVVIAGHAESFRATLGEAFKDAEIIPQKALDLDATSLRAAAKDAKGKAEIR